MVATSQSNDEMMQASNNQESQESDPNQLEPATGDPASEEAHAEARQAIELGKIRPPPSADGISLPETPDKVQPADQTPPEEQQKQLEGLQTVEELEKKKYKSTEAFKGDGEDVKPGSKGDEEDAKQSSRTNGEVDSSTQGTSLSDGPGEVVNEHDGPGPLGPGAHAIEGIGTPGMDNELAAQSQVSTVNAGEDLATGVPAEEDPQVEAYLVDDPGVPVAEVTPIMPFFQRKEGRRTVAVVGVLLSALAILLGVFLTKSNKSEGEDEGQLSEFPSLLPTDLPSSMPSFDARSTLAIVQDRGVLNCGVEDTVAANVLGDPGKVNLVKVGADRFERLHGRDVDLLIAGEESTMAKAVREPTTGGTFLFGYPYYGATVHYIGLQKYVQCAVEQKRFGECKDLSICAFDTSDIRDLMTSFFPGPFVQFGPFPEMEKSLKNGTCNVLLSDTYRIYGSSLQEDIDVFTNAGKYIISDMYIARKQLGQVTRIEDGEWTHIVEGTRHWSARAFQIGIGKDDSSCPATNGDEFDGSVNFFNGVYCVGNYGENFQRSLGPHLLGVSTIPYIDAVKFGPLTCDDCENIKYTDPYLREIVDAGKLKCGIYLDPLLNITTTSVSTLIAEQLCRAIGVAIFQGKPNAAEISYLEEMDFSKFPDEFDVMLGVSWEDVMNSDEGDLLLPRVGEWTPNVAYFFHDKYMYKGAKYNGVGKADIFMTNAKRTSKFITHLVASVFTAIVDAQRRGISRANFYKMPLIEFLGEGLSFIGRDVVAFAGNYDDIFEEAYAKSDGLTERGDWNIVLQNSGVNSPKLPTMFCGINHGLCPPTEYAFEVVPGVYYWNWEY
ncbi:hypothetical protein THAOC_01933 [Thalassiosira oceanica]|uniref:Solute-binding protein family 3/N-terminal domain-containing protein n=1 Tax=Thalassiosira oceanica TaxID=159749 RepID=K0TG17_THAOC|nr:hypothetical protein THAOC_01933 [Thalassiosira oceanica]|eukprot:EJK76310.1 hypothetical protein THAOC_01933 [Thalassiosira oceanica]